MPPLAASLASARRLTRRSAVTFIFCFGGLGLRSGPFSARPGSDTGSSLSRVFTVVLHLLVGTAFPVMRLILEGHPVPPGMSEWSTTGVHVGRPPKKCYARSPLIRGVADATVCGTCRDCPHDYIDIKYVRQELMVVSVDGADLLYQNGRVGHALGIARYGFPTALLATIVKSIRTRRRGRTSRADKHGIISEVCHD